MKFVDVARAIRSRARRRTARNRLIRSWVVPVDQPLIFICQLSRSGGTMLLRLLDNHPELHVLPRPVGFGAGAAAWPDDASFSATSARRKLDLSATNAVGLTKSASKDMQRTVPIYFDGIWYRELCRVGVGADGTADGGTTRECLNRYFTAFFNAWRNYQNLYGDKKYVACQSILRPGHSLALSFENFRKAYPDGYWVFLVRPLDDWLSSMSGLRPGTINYEIESGLSIYAQTYADVARLVGEDGFIPIHFPDFVSDGASATFSLAEKLGIAKLDTLLTTTTNGVAMTQNSSHGVMPSSGIDRTRGHTGKGLDPSLRNLKGYDEAQEAYRDVVAALRANGL